MKVAVTSTGPTLEDRVDPRFGRCAYFLIGDPENTEFEPVENPNVTLGGGAGIQSAQLLADRGVEVVLTGNCGPNAYRTLDAAGIRVIVGVGGAAGRAVEQFSADELSAASNPNVAGHFGAGGLGARPRGGMAGGVGGGAMGPGMGRGGGRGRRTSPAAGGGFAPGGAPPTTSPQSTPGTAPADELETLKAQAQSLSDQLESVRERIEELQQGGPSRLVAQVDAQQCTACGVCVEVCPTGAISVADAAQINREACIGCGDCVAECPQSALSLVKA